MRDISRRVVLASALTVPLQLLWPSNEVRATQTDEIELSRPRRFNRESTAEEVTAGLNLHGKTVLLTGCNSGIGYETMRVLVLRGAHVYGLARNREKASQACTSVAVPEARGKATPFVCEQTDLQSVASCADAVCELRTPIDILICNAGVNAPRLEQISGIEKDFMVNHLSHFVLVNRLLPLVQSAEQGRIVIVGSGAYLLAPPEGIQFDNLSGERDYNFLKMYGQSKLANGLFARELAHRLRGTAVTANVLDPGAVDTQMNRNLQGEHEDLYRRMAPSLKTPAQGAATTCFVATEPSLAHTSGAYFADCQLATAQGHMLSDELAAKLWKVSKELTRPYVP